MTLLQETVNDVNIVLKWLDLCMRRSEKAYYFLVIAVNNFIP